MLVKGWMLKIINSLLTLRVVGGVDVGLGGPAPLDQAVRAAGTMSGI